LLPLGVVCLVVLCVAMPTRRTWPFGGVGPVVRLGRSDLAMGGVGFVLGAVVVIAGSGWWCCWLSWSLVGFVLLLCGVCFVLVWLGLGCRSWLSRMGGVSVWLGDFASFHFLCWVFLVLCVVSRSPLGVFV
jgi:hypothetical protein